MVLRYVTNIFIEHVPKKYKIFKDFKNYFEGDRNGGLAVSIVRHEKAKKLLFKILEQRIERWWD